MYGKCVCSITTALPIHKLHDLDQFTLLYNVNNNQCWMYFSSHFPFRFHQ